ncbi:hypothetical protein BDZ91DRAFT_760734 [Kalaharituber pfeilii]|nr:hypothetical protein BDZ91DRAFT_760734 [Kalaharituber pfeilii]
MVKIIIPKKNKLGNANLDKISMNDMYKDSEEAYETYRLLLVRLSRIYFARYFYVFDEVTVQIIDAAAEIPGGVDRISDGFQLAYKRFYKFKTMYALLGSNQSLVDLRACMVDKTINSLYDNVFTWAMFGTAENMLSRTEYLRRLRSIGSQKQVDSIKKETLILLPERPVAKIRKASKKNCGEIRKRDFGLHLTIDCTAELYEYHIAYAYYQMPMDVLAL